MTKREELEALLRYPDAKSRQVRPIADTFSGFALLRAAALRARAAGE